MSFIEDFCCEARLWIIHSFSIPSSGFSQWILLIKGFTKTSRQESRLFSVFFFVFFHFLIHVQKTILIFLDLFCLCYLFFFFIFNKISGRFGVGIFFFFFLICVNLVRINLMPITPPSLKKKEKSIGVKMSFKSQFVI